METQASQIERNKAVIRTTIDALPEEPAPDNDVLTPEVLPYWCGCLGGVRSSGCT